MPLGFKHLGIYAFNNFITLNIKMKELGPK